MREYKLNEYDSTEEANAQNLPQKISLWSRIKNFLFKEIDLSKPIVIELTPKEEKVLNEVHDFLFQEVKFPELHDFLFQDLNFFGKKKKQKTNLENEVNGNVPNVECVQNENTQPKIQD